MTPSPKDRLLKSARASAARGELRLARSAYRRAVDAGSDTDILVEFAVFEAGNGRIESARVLLERALRQRPDDSTILLNLAEVCRLSGDHNQAARSYEKVLALDPLDADAAFGLGEAQLALGRIAAAVTALRNAASLAPADAEVRRALGDALLATGALGEATEVYRVAIDIDPAHRPAWLGLAVCEAHHGRFAAACDAFDRADRLAPLAAGQLRQWARALLFSGKHELSLRIAERAVTGEPASPNAWQLCGACLMQMGRFDEAEASLRRALAIDPHHIDALEGLAAIGRAGLEDARPLECRLATDSSLPAAARASAGFALYRIYDRAGDRRQAFAALCMANAARAANEPFDAARHVDTVDRMIAAFDRDFFARLQPVAWRAPLRSIFILGLPRSGTTLTEQILAHYPEVHPGGERIPFRSVLGEALDAPLEVAARDTAWAEQQARTISALLARDADGAARLVTDKTPGNYMALPFIAWMFPDARIVHCRRDPRDTGFSCFEQNFRAGVSFAYRLDAFACVHRCYEKLWHHWRECGGPQVFDLHYEALVRDPETVGRKLVAWCGLEWQPGCLDMTKSRRAVQTASFWQVRQPINTGSIGKWRRYESLLGDFLAAIGPVDEP